MRDARRITATPGEYADMRSRDAHRHRLEAQRMLAEARDNGAEWYQWIADGRPALTPAQYQATLEPGARSRGRRRG